MHKSKFFAFLVWLFYRAWTSTWRTQIVESSGLKALKESHRSWICAIWHGDELAMVHFCQKYRAATMTSTSKDGELMNNVLLRMGMATSRGSSTRGAVGALKGLVRLAKNGWCPVVAVDGPKGPFHFVKAGVFELSRLSGLPIVPVGVAASHSKVFEKSWNKAALPLPTSKVVLCWGDPYFPADGADPRSPELSADLKSRLDAMSRIASETLCK